MFNKSFRLSLVLVLFALGMQGCMCGKEETATTEETAAPAAEATAPAQDAAPAADQQPAGETHTDEAHAE